MPLMLPLLTLPLMLTLLLLLPLMLTLLLLLSLMLTLLLLLPLMLTLLLLLPLMLTLLLLLPLMLTLLLLLPLMLTLRSSAVCAGVDCPRTRRAWAALGPCTWQVMYTAQVVHCYTYCTHTALLHSHTAPYSCVQRVQSILHCVVSPSRSHHWYVAGDSFCSHR